MNASSKLYTREILTLATELAAYPLDDLLRLRGSARSQICGSAMELGLQIDDDGRIVRAGAKVTACAVGQAAAALFIEGAAGRARAEIELALSRIEAWLAGRGEMPDWPRIEAIAAARDYPGRHGAIILPWKAALATLP